MPRNRIIPWVVALGNELTCAVGGVSLPIRAGERPKTVYFIADFW